ncbi:hypothetical protein [Volucribacter amazonae]|uniref:Uncharacterized protein n=1 Tax=Volucribacter amazonae TaxID=256731 RepID=A0A9X4PRN2_9PAST|nr:hypothetical protein [Volucribacter amazonae]MDG6896393.1 hypothetical protein [Volucribacter amazonae]
MKNDNELQKQKYKKPELIFIEDSSLSALIPLVGVIIFITIITLLILIYKLPKDLIFEPPKNFIFEDKNLKIYIIISLVISLITFKPLSSKRYINIIEFFVQFILGFTITYIVSYLYNSEDKTITQYIYFSQFSGLINVSIYFIKESIFKKKIKQSILLIFLMILLIFIGVTYIEYATKYLESMIYS